MRTISARVRNELAAGPSLTNFPLLCSGLFYIIIELGKISREVGILARLSDPVTILKGIGPAKAKALMIKFGTLERIGNATEEELLSVKGITAENVKEIKKSFLGE